MKRVEEYDTQNLKSDKEYGGKSLGGTTACSGQ
jgi:hypothetical protein